MSERSMCRKQTLYLIDSQINSQFHFGKISETPIGFNKNGLMCVQEYELCMLVK